MGLVLRLSQRLTIRQMDHLRLPPPLRGSVGVGGRMALQGGGNDGEVRADRRLYVRSMGEDDRESRRQGGRRPEGWGGGGRQARAVLLELRRRRLPGYRRCPR